MRKSTALLICIPSAMVLVILALLIPRLNAPPVPTPSTQPATAPATHPSTVPTQPTTRITDYSAFAGMVGPRLKDAEKLRFPIPLDISAALVSDHPVHLDLRGDLWITHPDAPAFAELPITTGDQQTHLTRDTVVFVFWARDARGRWIPYPILRTSTPSPTTSPTTTAPATAPTTYTYAWHTPSGPRPLSRNDYRWDAVLILRDDRIVVPTTAGVAVLSPPVAPARSPTTAPSPYTPTESHTDIPDGKTPVQVFAVQGGALAFRPWDNGDVGSAQVYSLPPLKPETPSTWTPVAADIFPPQPIHIFPLTDGANLVLSAGVDGGVNLTTVAPPPTPDPDRDEKILDLIELLNDPKASVRTQAQADLARFGPTAWPLIESARDAQTPEAQELIRKILGLRAAPALGIFALLPGPVRIVSRSNDGSLALYTYGGVAWYEDGEDQIKSPALLFSRPGRRTQLVHESVLKDRKPEKTSLQLHYDDLLVNDDVKGPLRLMGNHIAPLLRADHKPFTQWIGVDRADRWIFTNASHDRWLILDPYMQDPTPKFPAWVIQISDGQTGWDKDNHVVIQRGKSPWRLERAGWRPLEKDAIITTHSPTPPTTNALFGGIDPATLLQPTSGLTASEQPIAVLKTSPNTVLLFDRPGRALRMTRPSDTQPFSVDATFTEFIPATNVRRIWLDPFNRICIAHDTNKLTIFFPEGRVPPELQNLVRTPSKLNK